GASPVSSAASRNAASAGLRSCGSILPPGNAICPGWLGSSVRSVSKTAGSLRSMTGTSTAAGRVAFTPTCSHIAGSRSRSPRLASTVGSSSAGGTSRASRGGGRGGGAGGGGAAGGGGERSGGWWPPRAALHPPNKTPRAGGCRKGKNPPRRGDTEHAFPAEVALLAEFDEIVEQRARHL